MAGVGLVGYSGSLIKDTVSDALLSFLNRPGAVQEMRSEEPEVTRVVIGMFNSQPALTQFLMSYPRRILCLICSNLVSSTPKLNSNKVDPFF